MQYKAIPLTMFLRYRHPEMYYLSFLNDEL